MGDRRALRALVTGLAVGVVIACAACTETGGGPGPTTGSAAATGAVAGSGGFKGGYDPSTKFTQLTAMFLTTPAPVEMTDGKVHLTYELVLTNAAPIPFQVDKIELHDAATSALVPNTTGRVDITPLAGGTEAEGTTDPGAGNTSATIPPGTTYVAWVDVVFPQRSAVPTTIEHVVTGAVLPPNGPPVPAELRIGRTDTATDGPVVLGAPRAARDLVHERGLLRRRHPSPARSRTHQRRTLRAAALRDRLLQAGRAAPDLGGRPVQAGELPDLPGADPAAAGGTVVAALDGFANTTALPNPPKPPPIDETVGNHVIVKVAEGVSSSTPTWTRARWRCVSVTR